MQFKEPQIEELKRHVLIRKVETSMFHYFLTSSVIKYDLIIHIAKAGQFTVYLTFRSPIFMYIHNKNSHNKNYGKL